MVLMFKHTISANTDDDTYINTSNISYDEKNNTIELSENSKINVEDTSILIDRGIIDYNKNEIEVFGNFYLYQELNILSGKDLKGDTTLNNFSAKEVSYIYNNDLKIDSKNAERFENEVYFYDNFLTPCKLEGYFDCPTWSLRIDKTKYDIKNDKFIHFDTFLQIADYKLFYLPYFTHYGVKAPRQKGFLTPTLELSLGGNTGIKTPYYYPINKSLDVTITPKFYLDDNFRFFEIFDLNTKIDQKTTGGDLKVEIENIKNENNNNINTSLKLNLKQVLDKNTILTANGLFTNSISTTRSINDEPIAFENIYINLDKYNFIRNNDYLKSELATVESFDTSVDSQIPISPRLFYNSQFLISDNISLSTNIDSRAISRNNSSQNNPSENYILNMENYLIFNKKINNSLFYNKISLLNSINDYAFQHNSSLNKQETNSFVVLSSELYLKSFKSITPRVKAIHFQEITDLKQTINEDSNALSFNYTNQFSDNRFYGSNLADNSSRIIYGIENDLNIKDHKFSIYLNQSYDFKKGNNFSKKINQNENFSDYSLEFNTNFNLLNFKSNFRIDNKTHSKKEMNYTIKLNEPLDLELSYNETSKNAYKSLSNDTKTLTMTMSKKINNNSSLSFQSNLDLKNNYKPYSESLTLSIFDECSQLDLSYLNKRYNDNYNTSPEQKLSITFSMDYLGFFGYEQSTNLFFEESGNFNYGL